MAACPTLNPFVQLTAFPRIPYQPVATCLPLLSHFHFRAACLPLFTLVQPVSTCLPLCIIVQSKAMYLVKLPFVQPVASYLPMDLLFQPMSA